MAAFRTSSAIRLASAALLLRLFLPMPASAQADEPKPALGEMQKQPKKAAKPAPVWVNVNTAKEEELAALPGVGSSTSKKIIAGRPYATVAELARAGVPPATIRKIVPLVTAGKTAPTVPADPAPAGLRKASGALPTSAGLRPHSSSGPAVVWVNTQTGAFHRSGSRWYGKTKKGVYMTEAEAVRAGYRAARQSKPTH